MGTHNTSPRWIKSPNISCVHGFSTRYGGVSPAPFDALNLGGSEDNEENISQNRKIALDLLDLSVSNLCNLKQVHGNRVNIAARGQQEGDALVSKEKGLILAISIADCYPILFHDPVNNVIGAAHAGWRGTVAKIAQHTLEKMLELGAKKENVHVAIGQGICQKNFEVGNEVIEQFEKNGFPDSCWKNNRINLLLCNQWLLEQNGIPSENIWKMERCTFEPGFFSYRRDKGRTGRMWAVISMR
jgi:hypothetical protein